MRHLVQAIDPNSLVTRVGVSGWLTVPEMGVILFGPMFREEVVSIGIGSVMGWSGIGRSASSSARSGVLAIVVLELEIECQWQQTAVVFMTSLLSWGVERVCYLTRSPGIIHNMRILR